MLEEFGDLVKLTFKGGYAFAEFAEAGEAADAIKELNARNGRRGIYLEPGKAQPRKQDKKPV